MTTASDRLRFFCQENTDSQFSLHSRSHKMQHLPLYIKRDDELCFGSKLRKYSSLLPFIRKNKEKTIALLGSCYSNHILSLVQLLKQEGIQPKLFLEKPKASGCKGNYFFLSLLTKLSEIHWIDKTFIPQDPSYLWIPIGGLLEQSLAGALTLALDILQNEQELQIEFEQIFIDAGTGISAIGLILGFAFLQKKADIHVVLMAGSEQDFVKNLALCHQYLEKALLKTIPFPKNFTLLFPKTGKSFGSTNQTILQFIIHIAQTEGIFLDPIYSSKLLFTAKQTHHKNPSLWIHSGGILSLTGFQESLADCAK